VTLTLEATLRAATHYALEYAPWRRAGLRQSTVSRVWQAFGLHPHRTEAVKLSRDPPFVESHPAAAGAVIAATAPCSFASSSTPSPRRSRRGSTSGPRKLRYTRRRSSGDGRAIVRTFICTSRPRAPRRSTSWSAGLPASPRSRFPEACTGARAFLRRPSSTPLPWPTSSPDRSAGRKRPTRSSPVSNALVDGSQTHETSKV